MNKIIDTLEFEKIVKMIPHRYPMLLIDKVIEVKKGESAIGIKNVTANENYFTGHFPGKMIHFPRINNSFSRINQLFSHSFISDQCMKMN